MTESENTGGSTGSKRLEQAILDQCLAQGEHVRLRAVQEPDFPRLAELLSAAPLVGDESLPWTVQRLRKQFADEQAPGLWGKEQRMYTVVDHAGAVVGFVQESSRKRCYGVSLQIDDRLADRDRLGRDLVAVQLGLLCEWFDPLRVESTILATETAKAEWLRSRGFELEVELADCFMHEGRPVACQIWGWVSPPVREEQPSCRRPANR